MQPATPVIVGQWLPGAEPKRHRPARKPRSWQDSPPSSHCPSFDPLQLSLARIPDRDASYRRDGHGQFPGASRLYRHRQRRDRQLHDRSRRGAATAHFPARRLTTRLSDRRPPRVVVPPATMTANVSVSNTSIRLARLLRPGDSKPTPQRRVHRQPRRPPATRILRLSWSVRLSTARSHSLRIRCPRTRRLPLPTSPSTPPRRRLHGE